MNTIFLKEVSDTVLNGKLIKLSYTNVSDDEYILELNIANKAIKNISKYITNLKCPGEQRKKLTWTNILNMKLTLNRLNKDITKIIKKNDLIGYSVIYSNNIKKYKEVKEYIDEIFNRFSINEYVNTSTVKENVYKYIDEYIKNNDLGKEKLKPIIFLNDSKNLDFELVEKLNSKYKEITIFSDKGVCKSFRNKIKRINDEYGSCIQVLDKKEKDFRKYNVYIFIDLGRTEYGTAKFSKKSCFIDFTNKENDKFNSKYIKLENKIKEGVYYSNKIKELYEQYGKITVSNGIIN